MQTQGLACRGLDDARSVTAAVAQELGCQPEQVLPFSTGVIGEYMPVERLSAGIPECVSNLSEDGWWLAAEGIMTTDTRPKGFSKQFVFENELYTVTGITKGAGMIHPNMATMLAYISTDAAVEQPLLQSLLQDVAEHSFNRITVDGDTSTNDSCLLVATGEAGNDLLRSRAHPLYAELEIAVKGVCQDLA